MIRIRNSRIPFYILNLVRDVRQNRLIVYLFTDIAKIGLIFLFYAIWMLKDGEFGAMFNFNSSDDSSCVHVEDNLTWIWMWIINAVASLLCYFFARTAAKALLQKSCYFVPVLLSTPVTLFILVMACHSWNTDRCHVLFIPQQYFWRCFDNNQLGMFFTYQYLGIAVVWFISQIIIGRGASKDVPNKLYSSTK